MTEFAVLKDFEGIANITRSKEEFVVQIKNQIENDSEEMIKQRIEFAKSNSWDDRANQFSNYLCKIYNQEELIA